MQGNVTALNFSAGVLREFVAAIIAQIHASQSLGVIVRNRDGNVHGFVPWCNAMRDG